MSLPRGVPERFFEIERAHAAFRVFELESAQIGSGRPEGPRSQLWGSIVVLARASLEEALRRVHSQICDKSPCPYTVPQLDPTKFRQFLTDHGVDLVDLIPAELHISLRQKPVAKAGHGTGTKVDGPLTSAPLMELLAGLNHIRNGFAHRDPRKTEIIPPSGAGLLWVAPEEGTAWTVQKPHAFSAMRVCQSVFRYIILCCWGQNAARNVRSPLPVLLDEQLLNETHEQPLVVADQLLVALSVPKLRDALLLVRELRSAVLAAHIHRSGSSQLTLPIEREHRPIFDPILGSSIEVTAANLGSLPSAQSTLFDVDGIAIPMDESEGEGQD